MEKKILVYHPFGNQNVRGILNGLSQHNMLHSFHTTFAVFPQTHIYRLAQQFHLIKILKREYDSSLENKTSIYPIRELIRQSNILPRIGLKNISSGSINISINKKVAKYISKKYKTIDAVYCYTHGALEIFKVCKTHNIKCFYELPIEYYKNLIEIIQKEKKENSLWANDIHTYNKSENLHIIDEELNLADCIIVASTYLQKSLIKFGFNKEKIHVVPYGFPPISPKKYRTIDGKIKILYVGGLHQLKGLSYMFDAVNDLSQQVELTIIGSGNISKHLSKELKKHKYLGSQSHQQVLKEMKENDILLFPTLSDGFGMVVSEAMSQGTPVIATDHCCSIDIIQDGVNGWIVPSRSSKAIKEKILYLLKHPNEIETNGKNALQTASSRSWQCYQNDIISIIKNNKLWH
jgi:glycosyltransferase involved in cell wall biosynthesis